MLEAASEVVAGLENPPQPFCANDVETHNNFINTAH